MKERPRLCSPRPRRSILSRCCFSPPRPVTDLDLGPPMPVTAGPPAADTPPAAIGPRLTSTPADDNAGTGRPPTLTAARFRWRRFGPAADQLAPFPASAPPA